MAGGQLEFWKGGGIEFCVTLWVVFVVVLPLSKASSDCKS